MRSPLERWIPLLFLFFLDIPCFRRIWSFRLMWFLRDFVFVEVLSRYVEIQSRFKLQDDWLMKALRYELRMMDFVEFIPFKAANPSKKIGSFCPSLKLFGVVEMYCFASNFNFYHHQKQLWYLEIDCSHLLTLCNHNIVMESSFKGGLEVWDWLFIFYFEVYRYID